MPRVTVTRTSVSVSGAAVTTTAADNVNGHKFQNEGKQVLIVNNGTGTVTTVTVDLIADRFGRTGSTVVAVPAGTSRYIGPFAKEGYNDGDFVNFTVSVQSAVNLAVISFP